VSEAVPVTNEPRRCLGTNQDGTPCGTGSELIMSSGYCFAHDPHRALDRKTASALGGIKSNATKRKGIDVGELNDAADAKRITARLVQAIAGGELPAATGRAALVGIEAWLKAHEQDELERRLAAWEAAQKGGH